MSLPILRFWRLRKLLPRIPGGIQPDAAAVYSSQRGGSERLPGNGSPPGTRFSFGSKRKLAKKNCRCFDAADPRLGGCTPPRPPKRRSEVSAAKRTQYYCPFLRAEPSSDCKFGCSLRTPAFFKRVLCRGGIYAARNLPWQPVNGQPPHTTKGAGCRPPLAPPRPQPVHVSP